ncbi:MAG: M28 family peptidase [Catalinimonas sp.]
MVSASVVAQDVERARRTIDTLGHPQMHGRGYVQAGDRRAADYLAGRMAEAGVAAAGTEGYLQPFPMPIHTFPGALSLQIDSEELRPGLDYLVHPAANAGEGQGRLLCFDPRDPAQRAALMKADVSRRAVAYDPDALDPDDDADRAVLRHLVKARALIHLVDQLTHGLSTVPYLPPTFVVKRAAFDSTARRVGWEVEALTYEDYPSQNVLGLLPGRTQPDSLVVITAHYDHLGRMGRDTYFPGANDNASGVSMLLELAHHYAALAHRPDYSLLFILFGGEEAGLIGSRYYVEHPTVPLERIRFLVNLDLLGTGDDGIMAVNATEFPGAYALLDSLNRAGGYLPKVARRGPAANSDHYFFYRRGVPSFFLYTLGGIAAYHDVLDQPNTLPLTRYEEVFQLLTDFIGAVQHDPADVPAVLSEE